MFYYPADICKAIYTTNDIESLNSVTRKVTKKHKLFPSDEPAKKVIYLATQNASKKWTMPIRNWKSALNRFITSSTFPCLTKTSTKRKNRTYTKQFKEETVALVTEQGYTVINAAEAVNVRANQIYNWKQRIEDESFGARLTGADREGLLRLRKEVKKLRIEKEILLSTLEVKKASAYFAKEMK